MDTNTERAYTIDMHHPAGRPIADTLGLVRLLFVDEFDEERRRQLGKAGQSFGIAMKLSRADLSPTSMGWRAIASHCDAAFATLDAMSWSDDVKALLEAARKRIDKAVKDASDMRDVAKMEEPSRDEKRGARDRRNA